MKPVYSMSSVGGCPRAVVAQRLGHDTVEAPEFLQTAAREGVRHEDWVAKDLEGLGWKVSKPALCTQCGRNGHHVELEFPAFKLVGHMDRLAWQTSSLTRVRVEGSDRLVEIKSLGRFRAEALVKALANGTFKQEFREYAMQVSCYHHASNLPILYAVKNRDTGKLDVFEFESPYTREDILEYVLELELKAKKDSLPPCEYKRGDFERTICSVKYMCAGEDEEPEEHPEMPEHDELDAAYTSWLRGKELQEEGKRLLDSATPVLLRTVKASGQKTYVVNNLKLTYVAAGKTTSYPQKKLKEIVPEELLVQVREEKPREEYVKVEERGET